MGARIRLRDYNNISETVSYSLYKIFIVRNEKEKEKYRNKIKNYYDANVLSNFLMEIAEFIGGYVLNISKQNYDPDGASVNLLISEGYMKEEALDISCNKGKIDMSKILHLDKSHITIHTYPELNNHNGIIILRSDIEISTCGEITPILTINKILEKFDSDVIMIDYKIRGFYRDSFGNKKFGEEKICKISKYIGHNFKKEYFLKDRVYRNINFSNCCLIKRNNKYEEEKISECIEIEKKEIFNSIAGYINF